MRQRAKLAIVTAAAAVVTELSGCSMPPGININVQPPPNGQYPTFPPEGMGADGVLNKHFQAFVDMTHGQEMFQVGLRIGADKRVQAGSVVDAAGKPTVVPVTSEEMHCSVFAWADALETQPVKELQIEFLLVHTPSEIYIEKELKTNTIWADEEAHGTRKHPRVKGKQFLTPLDRKSEPWVHELRMRVAVTGTDGKVSRSSWETVVYELDFKDPAPSTTWGPIDCVQGGLPGR